MSTTESPFGLFLPCPECGETHACYVRSQYATIDRRWECGRIESWDSNGKRWILCRCCSGKKNEQEAQHAMC